MSTVTPTQLTVPITEQHAGEELVWRAAGPGHPPPLPASAESIAAHRQKSSAQRVQEVLDDPSFSVQEKLKVVDALVRQIEYEKDAEANLDEPSLWKTLLDLGDVTFLHEPGTDDSAFEKLFGLHDVAKPYGWYRVKGGDLIICHCKEGYFAFDQGFVHAALVAKYAHRVLKWFDDEENGKTEGNWRLGGEPYDSAAPDQILEEYGIDSL